MPGLQRSVLQEIKVTRWPISFEAEFSRGIVKDLPRSSIPVGGVYDALDFLLDQPGLARKRGGSAYQSNAIGATTTGINFVSAAEFPTGNRVLALGADGHLYDATTGTASDRGAFPITTLDNPRLFIDKLIVASQDGTTGPEKVYVSGGNVTFAVWGGSPFPGKLVTTHLSRPVLGASAANPNRIVFGPVPDPETSWDNSNAYVDFTHSLTALASIQGVLLGFSAGATERLSGSVPPGTTGENMSLQPIGQVGCADARSIAAWGSYIIFASQDGVYITNGAGFDSLTEKPDGSGIQSYWRSIYATVAANSGRIAGGIYGRNYYILTLSYGTTVVDTLICYLPRKTWMRASNIACQMYAPASQGADELYGATISGAPGNRILALSGLFTPAAGNKNDANGTAVAPQLQLRMSGQGIGLKAFGHGHVTYDMRDAASDNPTMAISVATGIEAASFATVQEGGTLAETTDSARKPFVVNKDAQAVNLKFAQTNASSKTEIYAVELEARGYDEAADGG